MSEPELQNQNPENLPATRQFPHVPVVDGKFAPTDLEGVWRLSTILANSRMVPEAYHGRVEDTFVALSWGMEIGLSHNQSLQSIAVINGKPSIYGDAGLALVRGSGLLEDFVESFEGEFGHDDYKAVCMIKRKGDKREYRYEFSIEDAKLMGKWNRPTSTGKASIWMKYPKRMLTWRARWYALRDVFGDVLKGLHFYEEVKDSIDMEEDGPGHYVAKESGSVAEVSPKNEDSTPVETPENVEGTKVPEEEQPEPSDDDYVNPGPDSEPEPVPNNGVEHEITLQQKYISRFPQDMQDAAMKFIAAGVELNNCDEEAMIKDVMSQDGFVDLVLKWAKVRKGIEKVKEPEQTHEPEVVDEKEEKKDPRAIIKSKAALNYNGSISKRTDDLIDKYIDYTMEIAGLTEQQILMGMDKNVGDWCGYFESWCESEWNKSAMTCCETEILAPEDNAQTANPGDEGTGTQDVAPDETGPSGDDTGTPKDYQPGDDGIIKANTESWPSWKLKWNTMRGEHFKPFVWSNLSMFERAETEAKGIAKRARKKWRDQNPDETYPVDAKKQADNEEQQEVAKEEASGDMDASRKKNIDNRWNFIQENYPVETDKAIAERKMAKGGLSYQAKGLIIQDVYEAVQKAKK